MCKDRGRRHGLWALFCEKVQHFTPLDLRSDIRSMSSIQPICKCRCPPLPVSHSPVPWTWYGFFVIFKVLLPCVWCKLYCLAQGLPQQTSWHKKTNEISWNLWKNMLVGSEKRKPLDLHSVYITSLCSPPNSGSDFCLEYTLGCELPSLRDWVSRWIEIFLICLDRFRHK